MISDAPQFEWRYVAICGGLWGVLVSLALSLTQAVGGLGLGAWLVFIGKICPPYVMTGLIWAAGAKLAEQSRRLAPVLGLTAICAWTTNLVFTVLLSSMFAPGDFGRFWAIPLWDLTIFGIWTSSFYGGLYVLGFFATRRAAGLRRRLAYYRVARDEAEAQLREARLRMVRDQVQPSMILEALSALGRNLAEGGGERNRLFDPLIAFLRAVTPDLRGDANTLSRALLALGHYAELRQALESRSPQWRIRVSDAAEGVQLAPLRLLSAADRLSRMAPQEATLDVVGFEEEDAFVLRISVRADPPLCAPLVETLRNAVRQELGAAGAHTLVGPAVAEFRIAQRTKRRLGPYALTHAKT